MHDNDNDNDDDDDDDDDNNYNNNDNNNNNNNNNNDNDIDNDNNNDNSIVRKKNHKPVVEYCEYVQNIFPVARKVRSTFMVCTPYGWVATVAGITHDCCTILSSSYTAFARIVRISCLSFDTFTIM